MTDKKLKKDLNRYFRLAKKNFPLRYNSERIEIEDRAFEILNLFERGCLNISGQDYAAWADYINIFGGPDKECLLEKLQSQILAGLASDFEIPGFPKRLQKTPQQPDLQCLCL